MSTSNSTRVTFGDGGGSGEGVSFARLFFKVQGQRLFPAIVTNLEIEWDGDTTAIQDQCGNIQRRNTGNRGWLVRVQGIITDADRSENLSVKRLREDMTATGEATIVSDIIEGTFVVSNIVITESAQLTSIETPFTDGEEQAFEFQIQLGERSNSN